MTRINSNRQPNKIKMVHNWLNIIQDYLLPPTCLLCGNKGFMSQDLCDCCYQRLLRNKRCCYRCAEILEHSIASPTLCGRCISTPPAFDETYAPYVYQEEIKHYEEEIISDNNSDTFYSCQRQHTLMIDIQILENPKMSKDICSMLDS